MSVLLAVFLGALLLALLLTHRVRGWALGYGLVDVPDAGRHDHDAPVARAGGIAVAATVYLVVAATVAFASPQHPLFGSAGPLLLAASGAAAMFVLGLWDDIHSLSARTKLPVQVLVALLVFAGGLRIESLPLLAAPDAALPLPVSLLVTVVWLVGVTNAFNLIDGSDGVAAGAAVLACAAMGGVSLVNGNELGALVCFALAGAALGFLFFNFPPATIFLGDSGSLFIGFMLAAIAVVTTQTMTTAVAVAIPVVSLGLPILDTVLVMVRRFLRRKPLFQGDRRHIHHVLRDLGHSPRRVALMIYAVCGAFAFLSLLLAQPGGRRLALPFLVAGIILWIAVQRLRIPELVELGRAMRQGFAQREMIAHNMGVREAALQMRKAREPAALMAVLESAFDGSEFLRAELWLPMAVASPLLGVRSVRRSDEGCLWRWAAPHLFRDEGCFEVRLPFCDEGGRRIGRLSLWRLIEGRRLHTDIQLITAELLPELERALRRMRNRDAEVRTVVPSWTEEERRPGGVPVAAGRWGA